MFMTNIEDLKESNLYICNAETAKEIIKNGFIMFGVEKDKYYFTLTNELIEFLENKHLELGGDIT